MARVAQISASAGAHQAAAIELSVTALLAPYKKHGRLSIRVEKAPQGSRLTRGTRNNDGSWSLASDELDDLGYVPPPGFDKPHSLSLRVIGLQTGGTLAVIDLPVTPGAERLAAQAPAVANDAADLRMLREELAKAKETIAKRDAELAERLAAAAGDSAAQFKATLEKAEAAWSAGEAARLAAAEAQWQEDFAQVLADTKAEAATEARAALNTERREWQDRVTALEASLAERDADLERAVEAGDAARERGQNEVHGARAQLTALQAAIADRDAQLAEAQRTAEEARAAAGRALETALANAEQDWKDGEASRLAAAEARWRESAAKALAEAQAHTDTLRAQGTASEQELLDRLAALQAAVAERDAALARATAAAEEAREQAGTDLDARLAKAEQNWKGAEASRTAALDAAWHSRLAKAVADAKAVAPQPAPLEERWDNGELEVLREKVKAAHAKLAERDAALSRLRKVMEDERRQWQRDAQDAIAKAARERKGDDTKKIAAAQAGFRKEAARDLAIATARAEAAEAALAHVRMRASDDTRLHTELSALRAALAAKESELAWERERRLAEHPVEQVEAQAAQREHEAIEAKPNAGSTMFRDIVIAACFGVVGVIFWPDISGAIWGTPHTPKPKAAAVVPVVALAPTLPRATVTKAAKLRAEPKGDAPVVGKLVKDADLAVLEERDGWSHVRLEGAPGPVQGWVRATALKATAEPKLPPPPAIRP